MRSLNLTKSVALSNVVLGMVICGREKRKISVKYCSEKLVQRADAVFYEKRCMKAYEETRLNTIKKTKSLLLDIQ